MSLFILLIIAILNILLIFKYFYILIFYLTLFFSYIVVYIVGYIVFSGYLIFSYLYFTQLYSCSATPGAAGAAAARPSCPGGAHFGPVLWWGEPVEKTRGKR